MLELDTYYESGVFLIVSRLFAIRIGLITIFVHTVKRLLYFLRWYALKIKVVEVEQNCRLFYEMKYYVIRKNSNWKQNKQTAGYMIGKI